MIYLFIILLLTYGIIVYDCKGRRGKITKKLHLIICLCLIIIAGFRYYIGGDTHNYVDGFNEISRLSKLSAFDFFNSRYQPGWIVFVSTIKTLWNNFLAQQIIEAVIINLIIIRFIRKYSPYVFLTTLIYFLLNYFEYNTEIMREGLSVVIGLFAYELFDNKRYIFASFLVVLAFQIHISALVLCMMPLASKLQIKNKTFYVAIVVIAMLPSLYMSIPNIDIYVEYLFGNMDDWMKDSYLMQSYSNTLNIRYYIIHILKYLLIPFSIIKLLNKIGDTRFSGLVFTYSAFQTMGMISYAFYRFANYFAPFFWIALSVCVMHYIMNRTRSKLAFLMLFMACFLSLYQSVQLLYDSNEEKYLYERYIPYVSVFDGKSY